MAYRSINMSIHVECLVFYLCKPWGLVFLSIIFMALGLYLSLVIEPRLFSYQISQRSASSYAY